MRRLGKLSIRSPVYSKRNGSRNSRRSSAPYSAAANTRVPDWGWIHVFFYVSTERGFLMLFASDAGPHVPKGSDCTRRPSPGLCSLTGLEAVLLHLHPLLFTANSTKF